MKLTDAVSEVPELETEGQMFPSKQSFSVLCNDWLDSFGIPFGSKLPPTFKYALRYVGGSLLPTSLHTFLIVMFVCWTAPILLIAQPFPVGTLADNFTLKDRRTGEDVSLTDFEGKVVVLDFFAFWCAPCAFSSPDIEQNIQRYYEERNGNANGVPVQVIAVNIENEDPQRTDDFITQPEYRSVYLR